MPPIGPTTGGDTLCSAKTRGHMASGCCARDSALWRDVVAVCTTG